MDTNELAAQIEPEIMASSMISESDYAYWHSEGLIFVHMVGNIYKGSLQLISEGGCESIMINVGLTYDGNNYIWEANIVVQPA